MQLSHHSHQITDVKETNLTQKKTCQCPAILCITILFYTYIYSTTLTHTRLQNQGIEEFFIMIPSIPIITEASTIK